MAFSKNGEPIRSLEEWKKLAPPRSDIQWTPERSAMETARAWLSVTSPRLPLAVESVLESHPDFEPCLEWSGEPEARLPFDELGEPRNSDLLLVCRDSRGPFLIAVEGKADETFGELIPNALAAAVEAKLANAQSNAVLRIEQLTAALLGKRTVREPHLRAIRYQLLTAAAGALAESKRRSISRTVLLVHEFVTSKTADNKHAANDRDLSRFVARLSHDPRASLQAGQLSGPFSVPSAPLFAAGGHLYVGKAVTNLRRPGV